MQEKENKSSRSEHRRRIRKRRSFQPLKEKERKKRRNVFILLSIGALSLILFVGLLTVSVAYYNSQTFLKKFNKLLENQLGAKVVMEGVRFQFINSQIRSVEIKWEETSHNLKRAFFKGIKISHNPLFFWKIRRDVNLITAKEGTLVLSGSEKGLSKLDLSFSGVKQFSCDELKVKHINKKDCLIEGARVSTRYGSLGFQAVNVSNAKLSTRFLSKFTMVSAALNFSANSLKINGTFKSNEFNDHITVKGGVISDYKLEKGVFPVTTNSLVLGSLMPKSMNNLIKGVFLSEGGVLGYREDQKSFYTRKALLLKSSSLTLQKFPFLKKLKYIFSSGWYEYPEFKELAQMQLELQNSNWALNDIKLESFSKLKIQGNLEVSSNGDLSGLLNVGCPISLEPVIREKAFPTSFKLKKDGFLWHPIKLSGTIAAPMDDFELIRRRPLKTSELRRRKNEDRQRELIRGNLKSKEAVLDVKSLQDSSKKLSAKERELKEFYRLLTQ